MQKPLRKILIIGIVLIMCVGILCACNDNDRVEKLGEFYSLEEAYEHGYITKEDLQNIAYYNNPTESDYTFVPAPKSPETLDSQTEYAIKTTRAYDLRHADRPIADAKPDGVVIINYCGTYNGFVAVLLEGYYEHLAVHLDIDIDGVVFHYFDSNKIVLWKAI